jgi:DNA-binding XRE family transcriptional regulator
MRAATKKPRIDGEMVTLTIQVQKKNVSKIQNYVHAIEVGEERNYTVAEVFPEYIGKEHEIALRAYRTRQGMTQKQLSKITGIPQRHISEMENGKRGIGKDRAKLLAEGLQVSDYRVFL